MRDNSHASHLVKSQNAYRVCKLHLKDFRNYETLSFECNLTSVVIIGDNGAGKTNILESLSLLAPGTGLRKAPLASMIRKSLDTEPSKLLPTSWSMKAVVAAPL